jgi:arginyl-tRNA synthetase
VYLELQKRLGARIRTLLQEKYNLQLETIALEIPPELKFGELSTPIAFELARKLRKAPKVIALEIVEALKGLEGFAGFEVAGAGYINARLDRSAGAHRTASATTAPPASGLHVLVEHTSINPNKAAHVGHLRNAILGDTFVRLLRAAGQKVDIQNYIDNTGVQVADIVVDLMHLPQDPEEGKTIEVHTPTDVKKLMEVLSERLQKDPNDKKARIDYYCWDHYARVNVWYGGYGIPSATDPEVVASLLAERKQFRLDTLHNAAPEYRI